MDERAEQRVAVREVTVDSAYAHAGELGDGGHWDLLSLAPHKLGGRVKYARAVGGGVFAGLTYGRHGLEDRSELRLEKADDMFRIENGRNRP